MIGDRAARAAAHRWPGPSSRRVPRSSLRALTRRLRARRRARPDRDPRLPRFRDRRGLAALGVRPRRAGPALPGDGLRPRLRRPRALLCAALRSPPGSRCGSTAPTARGARSPSSPPAPGALAATAAVLLVPGAVGHAGQTSPRGLSVAFDCHASARRLGLDRRPGRPARAVVRRRPRNGASPRSGVVVPRFSAVALTAVLVLLASGTGSTIVHMPAVNALWDTSYGVAILVKIGLLAAAVALASGNLLRTRPGSPRRAAIPPGAAARRRGCCAGCQRRGDPRHRRRVHRRRALQPGPAAAGVRARQLRPRPRRPGPRRRDASPAPAIACRSSSPPTRPRRPDASRCASPAGAPVRGATVTLAFNHLQMEMPQQTYALREVTPGRVPALRARR